MPDASRTQAWWVYTSLTRLVHATKLHSESLMAFHFHIGEARFCGRRNR